MAAATKHMKSSIFQATYLRECTPIQLADQWRTTMTYDSLCQRLERTPQNNFKGICIWNWSIHITFSQIQKAWVSFHWQNKLSVGIRSGTTHDTNGRCVNMMPQADIHGMHNPNRKTMQLNSHTQGSIPNQTTKMTKISKTTVEDAASKHNSAFTNENGAEMPLLSVLRSRY